jgi:hypothetical protein
MLRFLGLECRLFGGASDGNDASIPNHRTSIGSRFLFSINPAAMASRCLITRSNLSRFPKARSAPWRSLDFWALLFSFCAHGSRQPLADDERLAIDLAVILAVDVQRVPVLHGRDAPKGTLERDKGRSQFARWLTGRLKDYGYRFFRTPPPFPPFRK